LNTYVYISAIADAIAHELNLVVALVLPYSRVSEQ